MEAWIEQTFKPTGKTYDGRDIYGNVALILQDEQEEADFVEFLREHGVSIDEEEADE